MQQLRYISTAVFFIFLIVVTAVVVSRLFVTMPPDISQSPAAMYQQSITDRENKEFIAGKELYEKKDCRTCHRVTGLYSDLFVGSIKREYWTSVNKIASFLRNPESFSNETYLRSMWDKYGMSWPHRSYPDITDEQMNLMYKYIVTAELKNN
jgi:hypothetical protein